MICQFISNVELNKKTLLAILGKNHNQAYQKVNELARFTGKRFSVDLQLHFPDPKKITDIDSYGKENIGVIVDKFRRRFPVPRETVKLKSGEIVGKVAIPHDAYMYEGKEGVKIALPEGQRIEVLPGSVHFWCKVDTRILAYGDWLFENVYFNTAQNSLEN